MSVLFLYSQTDWNKKIESLKKYGTKFLEDKSKDCRYCYFWCGKNKRYFLGKENCGYKVFEETVTKSEYDDLPYGSPSPCVCRCTKKVLSKDGNDRNGI